MAGTTDSTVIDVVDAATGEPVGTATREEALQAGLPIRSVHVLLMDPYGRLIVQQLGRGRDRHQGLLGSSVAAFPRPGETEEHAATRRMREELGLSAPLTRRGRVVVRDENSPKFVTVFEGIVPTDETLRLEPGHVERVDHRSFAQLDEDVLRSPELFTDTFREVYTWWREREGGRTGR